jgi:hypothetical protein
MRCLLAIGCNAYAHAAPLSGAEIDAQRIFDALLKPEVGQYDPDNSKLLLSPALEEIRQALREVLISVEEIETFTFFFAGHGSVRSGSFYMWVRDTTPTAQALSALSLGELFRCLSEVAPRQTNIIIDACESGGLITDLGILLKPELLGNAGTPAVTLVATSAQDQASRETEEGGIGTSAIMDCIEGRDFVQDTTSVLDLVDIWRTVSQRLKDSGQNPTVWGLNLCGPPQFCRNPKYESDPSAPLRDLVQNWPVAGDAGVKENYRALWKAYDSLGDSWDRNSLLVPLSDIFQRAAAEPLALSMLAERLATTFMAKAGRSTDQFLPSQIAAIVTASLLPYIDFTPVAQAASRLLNLCGEEVMKAGEALATSLVDDQYALLSNHGGAVGDLYQLPIRISKVLGWAAASCAIFGSDPGRRDRAQALFGRLLSELLDKYGASILALSDAQTPCWATALACGAEMGLQEECEELAGRLFHSVVQCAGQLARWDLPPSRALDYLRARAAEDFSPCFDLVERPIETLTVLLRIARVLDLDEVFDDSLWMLDGVPFSAYVPNDWHQYGLPLMDDGENLCWSVGHDVFLCSDLAANWASVPEPPDNLVSGLAVVSCLLREDRVPWFLLNRVPGQS